MAAMRVDECEKARRYLQLRSGMSSERSSFESHWRELADFVKPRRLRFQTTDRNKGDRRNQNIIDSTATIALRTLQSGMHAGLTSPARPWLRLTTPDPDLAEHQPVKEWLHVVTQRLLTVFLQSNLYNHLPTVYGDMGLFGTSAMAVVEDDHNVFRCISFPLGSYFIGLDSRQRVSLFSRDYQLTVQQLVEEFGGEDGKALRPGERPDWDHLPAFVKTAFDNGQLTQSIEVTWAIGPNVGYDPEAMRADKRLPYYACYFTRGMTSGSGVGAQSDTTCVLRESGYHEFPVMAPRWDVTGEDTYGTDSPGMMALGDVKQLQGMSRKEGQAISKMVDPPLQAPSTLRNQKTSLLPGDITYVDERAGQQGVRPIFELKPDLGAFLSSKQEVQYRIRQAFFADLFLMLAQSDGMRGSQPLTAREIDERHEEKLLALGPVLERTNDELLDPLVDRTFGILLRAGGIPEPPEELVGVNLRVEYTSLMAQAQKLVSIAGQDRFVQTVAGMAGVFPEALDKVDVYQIVDDYADHLGVNPKAVRSSDEAQGIAQHRAQVQQQAQQAEQVLQGTQGLKNLGQAQLGGGDTALQQLVQGAGGA